jgi:hypothetical protein
MGPSRRGQRGCQTACKPGSVPGLPMKGSPMDDHSSGTLVAERLTRPTRAAARKRARPQSLTRSGPAAPIRSCSRWGLPCHHRCRRRGALLPHPFTLAWRPSPAAWRSALCGTFPGVAPAGCYPAPCFRGARTFLSPASRGAAIQPSGRQELVSGASPVNRQRRSPAWRWRRWPSPRSRASRRCARPAAGRNRPSPSAAPSAASSSPSPAPRRCR